MLDGPRVPLQVAVNGNHLLEYAQRVNLDQVDTLGISGTVSVQAIAFFPAEVRVNSVFTLFSSALVGLIRGQDIHRYFLQG